jgi:hypothetical protein
MLRQNGTYLTALSCRLGPAHRNATRDRESAIGKAITRNWNSGAPQPARTHRRGAILPRRIVAEPVFSSTYPYWRPSNRQSIQQIKPKGRVYTRAHAMSYNRHKRASYNGSIEASQASDVGSIPIARSRL